MSASQTKALTLGAIDKWLIINALIEKRNSNLAIIADLASMYGDALDASAFEAENIRIKAMLLRLEPTLDLDA